MRKAIVRATLLLLAATPAALSLAVILHFGVDVHTGDEWDPEVAGVFIKAHQHQLTFGDLVSLHNEHRLLVPRLLYLLLNVLTKWNNIADLVGGWLIFCATSAGILWLMRETDDQRSLLPRPGIAGRWFVCNLLLFDPAQYENWLSGWGLANALPGALTVAAILAARTAGRSWARTTLCILLAAGATFSNGCGFLAWGLAGIVLAWSASWQEFRGRITKLIAMAAAMFLCAGLYFLHYQSPPRLRPYAPSFGRAISFVVNYTGNPFRFSTSTWQLGCPPIGVVLLLLLAGSAVYFLDCWRRRQMEQCGRVIVWLAVGGFGLGTAILGAMSRSGYGIDQDMISRYVTFSIFIPLSLVNLGPLICRDLQRRRVNTEARFRADWNMFPAVVAGALVALILVGINGALDQIRKTQEQCLAAKGALMLLNVAPNNPRLGVLVHTNVTELTQEANAMNQMGYLHPPLISSRDVALIEGADPKAPHGIVGRFDNAVSDAPASLTLSGWAVDAGHGRSADEVFLTYQDANDHAIIFAAAHMGVERGDIAAGFKNPNYQYCGWAATVSEDDLPPNFGSTALRAWVLDTETGKAWLLQGGTVAKQ
jgi:hypothetical protein